MRVEVLEADCYAAGRPLEERAALVDRLSQVQGRLERAYFKAYKELERIKAARQKRPEESKPDPSKDHLAPKFQVGWVNPETGVSPPRPLAPSNIDASCRCWRAQLARGLAHLRESE